MTGTFSSDVIDGKRAAVEEENDDRLACRDHGLDQLFLPADEIEAGTVAHVVQAPGFARGLLISADGKHDDVGLARHFDGFGNLLAVFDGIAGQPLRPGSSCRRW